MTTGEPRSESLRALYWRDEILQVAFWIEGEGFGDQLDPRTLERFLGVGAETTGPYLERMVSEGLLSRVDGRFRLTDRGRREGGRLFADEFSNLTKPAHGECGPDCWCHSSVEEAEACAAERAEAHR